ncbi:MAG TPA: glycosyltransferase family 4 protein [Tepidisphaeraceae bacterium]|nr:glycosyltransferase family 4 protein [Tepidisphaeraceae bacterium]
MKITIVTGPFFASPPAPCGAVERLWQQLAVQFAQRRHSVTMVGRSDPSCPTEQTIDGVRILRHGGFPQTSFIALDLLTDFLYSLRQVRHIPASDIIITNAFWLPFLLTHLFRRHTPVLPTIGTMPKGQIFLYLRCSRLLAPSRAVKKAIERQSPGAAGMVAVVPNPIDLNYFKPPTPPRDFTGAKQILFAGRIHPGKNVLMLVRAFASLARQRSDVFLKIMGPWERHRGGGGQAYRDEILRLSKGLPVELCPAIYDRAELAAQFQQAHLFCLPSAMEAFGVAPLEAMATGAVPVVSTIDAFVELIPNDVGYFFDQASPDAVSNLAGAINQSLQSIGELSARSERAAKVASDYGIANIASGYLEVFEQVMQQ